MFCEVYLFDLPYHLDRAFDYACDEDVRVGSFVKVPFGRSNNLRFGVVLAVKPSTESANVKPVHSVTLADYALTDRMRGLCLFLKEHTLCTVGEAVRCLLPPGALGEKINLSKRKLVSLAVSKEQAVTVLLATGKGALRSEGQRRIVSYLLETAEADAELVRRLPGVSSANVSALRDRGIISVSEEEKIRNPYLKYSLERDSSEIVLSRAQNEAFSELKRLYHSERAECALLHGVTGSGKTKVIIKLMDEVIGRGKRVLMMVPEISLTPQTVSIFCRRFGERVAVVHSSLSQGERQDAWRRIRRGEVDLVIGTRSAVFAPLENIGLIVIDEEHEHTYKSESDPKYHARDVASYICGKERAMLLLASATPALESYYKAKSGAYTLVTLKERYGGVTLPDAVIVDMREELRLGNTSPISKRLEAELSRVYENEEQSILFLNRRGYNSQVCCRSCGEVISCPRCSVSLTFHREGMNGGKMLCHLCGYTAVVPKVCPACEADSLSFLGFGTQKLEGELSRYLPEINVMRMDADTTSGKLSYDKLLDSFRREEADLLLGTQMVAKGHDFPKVTLVGVVLADSSLYVSDFRAAERTFSLLTQVIGRAGRAKSGGIAVIQTFSPKNEIIRLACLQDYEKFYEGEIALRRELLLPPFCDIATLTVTSESEQSALEVSAKLSQRLLAELTGEIGKLPFMVFGPFEAGVFRVNEKYRMKLTVKCKLTKEVRAMLAGLLREFSKNESAAAVSVDLNPLTT